MQDAGARGRGDELARLADLETLLQAEEEAGAQKGTWGPKGQEDGD